MKRPELHEIAISDAINRCIFTVTMSTGQWDGFLESAYNAGAALLELDENEMPVRAYQKRMNS